MDDYLPDYCFTLSGGADNFLPSIVELVKNSIYSQDVFEVDAWQPANKKNLAIVLDLINRLVYPNSKIVNPENLAKIQTLIDEGKSCVIMPEHYSNFDLPSLFYLIEKFYQDLTPIAAKIISLAASKLNAESKVVLAFSEAFNRIMIYPAREKENTTEHSEKDKIEQQQLDIINQRAIKTMLKARDDGKIILVFPSGTRYRPEKPESRNSLEQSVSFLKRFDYVCFIGIAGNTLIVNPNNNMAEDIIRKDSMVYWVDNPISCKDFINKVEGGRTNKTGVAKQITQHLLDLHNKAEKERLVLIQDTPPEYLGPITSPQGIANFIKKHNIDPAQISKLLH